MARLQHAPADQLALQWTAPPDLIDPHHLAEWAEGSAVSRGIAEQALESVSGEHAVLAFLKPKAINAHRTYAGPVPVNRWAINARRTFANPCRGGWLAYGHDPLADGRLVPVSFKPDHPRLELRPQRDGGPRPIKYERPAGSHPRPYFPPLDQASVRRICERAGIAPPSEWHGSWPAWRWLLANPSVQLCVDEGEKKSAAACSAGWLTIGLAGIWGGSPRPKDASGRPWGRHALIAELGWLKTVRPAGAPLVLAFDASDNPRGRLQIRAARRTLGHLLEAEGHRVRIREMVQPADAGTFIKGTDDLLVHGGADALAALPVLPLADWIKAGSEAALEAHLRHPFETRTRFIRRIHRHFTGADIPAVAPLVALIGGMGSNKTGAMAAAASTRPVVSITHRRSLADQQGLRLGLPVKREGQLLHPADRSNQAFCQTEAAPEWVEVQLAESAGFITVADSSHPGGSAELLPEHCSGKTLFIDEADAFLRHCLMADTAIKQVRQQVLGNLAACVRSAAQVVLAGAHLDEVTLQAFESMRGEGARFRITQSSLLPAGGRQATILRRADQLLQQARNLATSRQPFLWHVSSREAAGRFAPVNLARWLRRFWPDARILELTAATIRDPQHPASAAIRDPQQLLDFDVVLSSPVLETGFSIEDPAGHFTAVLCHAAGHTLPTAVVQSIGRLRSAVPRFIWCAASGARIGNGSTVSERLQDSALRHAGALAAHLALAGDAGGDAACYLRLWSELAAAQNWQARHYRKAVATLLELEGFAVSRLDQQDAAPDRTISEQLSEDQDHNLQAEAQATADAPAPSAEQLARLETRQRLTAEQRRMIERGRIERDLGITSPAPEQVTASQDGAHRKLLTHLLLINPEAQRLHHQQLRQTLTPSQRTFAPDLNHAGAITSRAQIMAGLPWLLDLLKLAGTGHTITMAAFEQAHAAACEQALEWRQLLGINPATCGVRTWINHLVQLLGFSLRRCNRRERVNGRRLWHYEVADDLQVLGRTAAQAHILKTLANTEGGSFLP